MGYREVSSEQDHEDVNLSQKYDEKQRVSHRIKKTCSGNENREQKKVEQEQGNYESAKEINMLEKKYFDQWLHITQEHMKQRREKLRKVLFNSPITKHFCSEEESLQRKWKHINNEKKEMEKFLYLNWTSPNVANYSFQYSRYLKEYKKNPHKWSDAKYLISSRGLEVKSARKWLKIDEMIEKLYHSFLNHNLPYFQNASHKMLEQLFLEKQREIRKIVVANRFFGASKNSLEILSTHSDSTSFVQKFNQRVQIDDKLFEVAEECVQLTDKVYNCLDGHLREKNILSLPTEIAIREIKKDFDMDEKQSNLASKCYTKILNAKQQRIKENIKFRDSPNLEDKFKLNLQALKIKKAKTELELENLHKLFKK